MVLCGLNCIYYDPNTAYWRKNLGMGGDQCSGGGEGQDFHDGGAFPPYWETLVTEV